MRVRCAVPVKSPRFLKSCLSVYVNWSVNDILSLQPCIAAARNVLYSILSISKLIKLQRMWITSSFPNLYSVEIAISKSRIFLLALLLNFFHNLNMLVGCKKIEWQGMTDVFSQRKLLRMHPINVNQNSKLNQCKMIQSNDL